MLLSLRQPLDGLHTLGNLMERLLVAGIGRHLRRAEQFWISERADLDDDGRKALRAGRHMGPAFRAEFSRDRALEIAALELLRLIPGVAEAAHRHGDEHIRRTAGDVLAFTAVALRFHHGIAVGDIAHLAAIAPTFKLHGFLPTTDAANPLH